METETAFSEISRNSKKFVEHHVGIIQHRNGPFRVSYHFHEFILISRG